MGAFACAMFFFISGFGLLCQYKNKENYLESFIRKRFSKILVPAIIVSGIYLIFKFLLYDDYTVSSVFFSSIEGHTPIVDNSWYIIELIVLYLMFYLTFRMYDFLIVKKNLLIIYPIMVLFVLSLLLVVFFVFINWGSNWYISTLAFPLGCYVASEKDKIASFINKYKICFILVFSVIIIVSTYYSKILNVLHLEIFDITLIKTILNIISNLLFCLLIYSLSCFFIVDNRIISFLSSISYELYMIHGLFIALFSKIAPINYDFLRILAILLCSISSAYLLNILNKRLLIKK